MKAKQFLLLIALLTGYLAQAQPHYVCDYDATGNRIKRYYTKNRSLPAPPVEDTTAVQTVEYPDLEENNTDNQGSENEEENLEEAEFRMLLYPNPTNGYFSLELPDLQPEATGSLTIVSKMGLPVYSQNKLTQIQTINISASPPDIYLIRIETGNKLYVVSIIKL